MLDHMELVEKLRAKANISFEEAKTVLEKNDWDLLDAMVELERLGKVKGAASSTDNSETYEYQSVEPTASGTDYEEKDGFKSEVKSAWKNFKNAMRLVWDKLIDNKFIIKRKGEVVLRVPVLVLVLLLLFGLWRTLLILLFGMLFKFRYSFEGEDLGNDKVNKTMDRANDFADSLMRDRNNDANED